MNCLSIVCQAQFVQALDTDGNGKLDYMEFVNAFQIPNNLAGTHNQDYYVAAHSNSTNSRPSSGASGNRAVWKSALGRHALVGGESLPGRKWEESALLVGRSPEHESDSCARDLNISLFVTKLILRITFLCCLL
jgi:hypothetical protein